MQLVDEDVLALKKKQQAYKQQQSHRISLHDSEYDAMHKIHQVIYRARISILGMSVSC